MRYFQVLIPDTVDIYEGRNIKTIFSLFALAKHLHRMNRGPSIRREENVQFSRKSFLFKIIKHILQNML